MATINVNFLKDVAAEGLIEDLALFLKLKHSFKNGCFFHYTQKRLSNLSGIPVGRIRKSVPLFLKKEWCRIHGNNLCFKPFKQIDPYKHKMIWELSLEGNLKDITAQLYYAILKTKQNQFDFLKKLDHDVTYPQNFKVYKSALRKTKKYGKNFKSSDQLKISFHTFSKWFKCSVGKAVNIIRDMAKRFGCVIISHPKVQLIYTRFKCVVTPFMEKNRGCFYDGSIIVRTPCNSYIF